MFKPKKSLGQNFLRDDKILNKIIEAASLKPDDLVLEIGPGQGILTEKITGKVKKVWAVEIDSRLAENLKAKFKDSNVEIFQNDILKIDINALVKKSRYKVVANIPYYITAPIIRRLLEADNPPVEIILMVQKEVAERITAKPGKMSLLAVSVQYYAKAEWLFNVSRNCFYPVPEVDSAVILLSNIKSFNQELNKIFFKLLRIGFAAKRKTLLNNIINGLHIDREKAIKIIKKVGLDSTVRAQELYVADWEKLATLLKKYKPDQY